MKQSKTVKENIKRARKEGRFPTYHELYPKGEKEYHPSEKAEANREKMLELFRASAISLGLDEDGTEQAMSFLKSMLKSRYSQRAIRCQLKKFDERVATAKLCATRKEGRYRGVFTLLAWFENITARGYVAREDSWALMQTLMTGWDIPEKKYCKHEPWRKFKYNRPLECRVRDKESGEWKSVSQAVWRDEYKGKEDTKKPARQSEEIAETVVVTLPKVYQKRGKKRERLSELPLTMDMVAVENTCKEIRAETDKEAVDALKRELPVAYLCHEKPSGRNRWKERYTGWLVLDIDHAGMTSKAIPADIAKAAEELKTWYPKVHCWRSATDGVCMYVKPDVEITDKSVFDREIQTLYEVATELMPGRDIDRRALGQDQARFVTIEMLELLLDLRVEYMDRVR